MSKGVWVQVSTIKILLADADEEFRILLNDTITAETDMEVIGSVGDGSEALELIDAGGVDVLVMDLVLSGMAIGPPFWWCLASPEAM